MGEIMQKLWFPKESSLSDELYFRQIVFFKSSLEFMSLLLFEALKIEG